MSPSAKTSDEFKIFHNGHVPESSHLSEKGRPEEEPLISIRHLQESRSPIGHPLDEFQSGTRGIQAKRKGTGGDLRLGQSVPNPERECGGKNRIGMEEKEEFSLGIFDPGIHLPGPTRGHDQDFGAKRTGDLDRPISASSIHDDFFNFRGRANASQAPGDV